MGAMVFKWIDFCFASNRFLLRKFSIGQIVGFGSAMYLVGIVLTMLAGHQDSLPPIMANLVNIYFAAFVTTRNGLFQSLVFVSIGMWLAKMEQLGKLRTGIRSGIVIGFIYFVKIVLSLFGGAVLLEDA